MYISTFAARTTTSLNWLCSQASAERSIIAKAALSCIDLSDGLIQVQDKLTSSSYLMYKNTSSGQRCPLSVALMTFEKQIQNMRQKLSDKPQYLGDVDASNKKFQMFRDYSVSSESAEEKSTKNQM